MFSFLNNVGVFNEAWHFFGASRFSIVDSPSVNNT